LPGIGIFKASDSFLRALVDASAILSCSTVGNICSFGKDALASLTSNWARRAATSAKGIPWFGILLSVEVNALVLCGRGLRSNLLLSALTEPLAAGLGGGC
jgi:hypothetical protein